MNREISLHKISITNRIIASAAVFFFVLWFDINLKEKILWRLKSVLHDPKQKNRIKRAITLCCIWHMDKKFLCHNFNLTPKLNGTREISTRNNKKKKYTFDVSYRIYGRNNARLHEKKRRERNSDKKTPSQVSENKSNLSRWISSRIVTVKVPLLKHKDQCGNIVGYIANYVILKHAAFANKAIHEQIADIHKTRNKREKKKKKTAATITNRVILVFVHLYILRSKSFKAQTHSGKVENEKLWFCCFAICHYPFGQFHWIIHEKKNHFS